MSTRDETIAIIGAGEMGAAVGRRMREGGARVITTLKDRGSASIERVARAQVEVVDDDNRLVREAGFILSIVPPGAALSVARRFVEPMKNAAQRPIFVDCNAVSPATVRRIGDVLASSGCDFIDAGIIGGPPRPGYDPRFYVSGPRAHAMESLRRFGLDIEILDDRIGTASALKMSYAGLTKGLVAIGAAMTSAASRAGLASALRAELKRSQPALLAMLAFGVQSMYPKAYRWIAEMEQIADFIGDPSSGATIYEGAARLYEQIARDWEIGKESCDSFQLSRAFFNERS